MCIGYTGTLPKFGLPARGPEEGWSLPSPTAQLPRMGRALRKENNEGVFKKKKTEHALFNAKDERFTDLVEHLGIRNC